MISEERLLVVYGKQRLKRPWLKGLLRELLAAAWRTAHGWQDRHVYDYHKHKYKILKDQS